MPIHDQTPDLGRKEARFAGQEAAIRCQTPEFRAESAAIPREAAELDYREAEQTRAARTTRPALARMVGRSVP